VGAQRPVGRGNEIKMTGARSARARTRGQNPLVINNNICLTFCLLIILWWIGWSYVKVF
jgi:hypothetical protein